MPFPTYLGMPVHVSRVAVERRPIFQDRPRTKRRVRRVVAKFGSWEREYPCAYRFGDMLVVHPVVYEQMRAQSKELKS